ncbi:uncharacterized protein ACJ7VT_000051 [Polymixia lowei]
MRIEWVVSGLSAMVSIGLAMVVFGQHKMLTKLNVDSMELDIQVEKLDVVRKDRGFLRGLLDKQLEQRKSTVDELEAEVAKLAPEEQKKKTENDACQTDKTKKNEELEAIQKEKTDTEAKLKTESEAWTQELATLKQQVEQRSKVCDFVKKDSAAEKLCDIK